MNINSTNINFKSRSPVVKKADKICRFVKTEFPSVSSSIIPKRCNKTLIDKVKRFGERTPQIENGDLWDIRYNKFRTLFFRVNEKLRTLVRKPFNDTIGVVEENKVLTKLIKNHHLANCAELTRLANLICAVNGIKSKPIDLVLCDSKERYLSHIDHVVLAIPLKEKAIEWNKMSKLKDVIIIDPWLDIADYAQNVAMQYQNLYRRYFDLGEFKEIGIDPISRIRPIEEKDFAKLREKFPELIINA